MGIRIHFWDRALQCFHVLQLHAVYNFSKVLRRKDSFQKSQECSYLFTVYVILASFRTHPARNLEKLDGRQIIKKMDEPLIFFVFLARPYICQPL